MGKGNVAVRQWMSDKHRFADLFNGVVFQGKQVIAREELELIDGESDIILTDKLGKEKAVQRYRDIVMCWKKELHLAVLACENQDQVHYAMAVRNMLYDGLSYAEQVRQIGKSHKEDGNTMDSAEFLSGFRKNDRIFPVITIVFYYDLKKWDGSLDLHGMFHLEGENDILETLKSYVPNYRINLVDVGNMEDIKRFKTDLQKIFGMLQYRGQMQELKNYIKENEDYFRNIDIETYQAAREFLHSKKMLKAYKTKQNGKGKIDMCKALEDLYNSGIEQVNALNQWLAEQNRTDDIVKAAGDLEYQKQLMRQFEAEVKG